MTASSPTQSHAARLLAGLAAAIAEKGYAATTIADVARHARVSKRTFYEHFADKETAFLALYRASADRVLARIGEAAGAPGAPWEDRIAVGVRAYLGELAAHPDLTRTFLVEVPAAGPAALTLRREVLQRFADGLRAIVEEARAGDPAVPELPDALATAVVGGLNELLLRTIEAGDERRLAALEDDATAFVASVLLRGREP